MKTGLNKRGRGRIKKREFYIFEKPKTNESKYKFEFKHFK
jgi:hypothetical protein